MISTGACQVHHFQHFRKPFQSIYRNFQQCGITPQNCNGFTAINGVQRYANDTRDEISTGEICCKEEQSILLIYNSKSLHGFIEEYTPKC